MACSSLLPDGCTIGKLTVGKAWTAADNYCSGTVLHMIPSKLLVQTWRASAWPSTTPSSTVITQLLPRYQSPNETRVILTHYGVPAGEIAERIESGWMEYVFEPIRVYLKDEKSKRAKRSGRNMAHVEIPAVDPERAGAFYKEVFGWDVSKWAEGYWGFTSGPRDHEWGFVDGGFPQATPTKPIVDHTKYAALTPYYDAYPVEEFEEKVKKAGGKVLKPKSATPYGVIAECEDTEGNAFVLYQMKAE
ncbi:uncharacterized protein EV422DRAFT_548330 [Fimicolochytrium jonesii]|uniref:uncharacterized protein n=1 Tax=Fimicolochytrium jonesii TaxID=1396493 RepID=UPI0022FE45AE|nr:uncharacterized protein EV422DRAFT_548330 [Fimicolochytrium jonesii]KAI8815769.1 hypothetical protein EV422DRAFT_548330 [Fimicolochytrium jonesii]